MSISATFTNEGMLNEFANGFLLMVREGATGFVYAFRRHCFAVD